MAASVSLSSASFFLGLSYALLCEVAGSQQVLSAGEQESVYRVLESVNSEVSWRSLFPDDLCFSAPHGVVCDFFDEDGDDVADTPHVTELSFGFVSDYSPNPPCTANSTISTVFLSPLKHLRKLFFYKCFTDRKVPVPGFSTFGSSLEELVFIENPALVGSLDGELGNLTSLRKLILTGTNVSGEIPGGLGDLVSLEQLTLSRNRFTGQVPLNISKLKKLKVLDLSENLFDGEVPEPIGGLSNLLKLDLRSNRFSGNIPESLKGLKNLEFVDLSYNRFSNSGIPLFLSGMSNLKEVYLNGNFLGGEIPEIWENLGGIVGISLSGTGLVGEIPSSMGIHLKNLCYLGLDNNRLEGKVPEEFGRLETLNEMNLQNNKLRGKLPFSAKFAAKMGEKLKLEGNPELCIDQGLRSAKMRGSLGNLKTCPELHMPNAALFVGVSSALLASHMLISAGFLFFLMLAVEF